MNKLLLPLLLIALTQPVIPSHAAGNEGIAAVVNQEAITKSDLDARLNLIAASTGMPRTPDLLSKLRPQVMDMLIEEQIKQQEAKRQKIEVSKEDVAAGFKSIADQNSISVEDFRAMLESKGIKIATMEDQIRTQLAWTKVVQKKIRPQIGVSDADVDSELEQLKSGVGKPQFRIAEIFLPYNENTKDAELSVFAGKLVSQLRAQPEAFGKVAQQFSQAPGAAQGGNIGWVSTGQLPAEVDDKLETMTKAQISEPIKTVSGYYIVLLQDKRQITEDLIPSRDDIMQKIGASRLDRAQRRYLMDLRSSAFIEKRD